MTPTSAPPPPSQQQHLASPGQGPTAATSCQLNPVSMSQLGTVYATKRRRRNGKSLKPPQKDGVTKSNPSKRHRERLNAELDTLASLLPFEQNILSKLDRLSILRLSVSYLRTKSYFQVVMHKEKEDSGGSSAHESHYRARELAALAAYDHQHLDGEMFLQALNGFLLILTCDGEVFFATHSIESYLGFHQSDIVHQSVYELVHSEDREELQRQLMWNSFLPAESATLSLHEALVPQHHHLLERSFTVRFRCLLDNTSGFLRLDIRGRVKVLHGQNRKTEEPPLALFALCTPFGPPSLLEVPQKEVMFKSKHKLDLALVSMDQRGKMLLGYSDAELANLGGYDLVHYDDLAYVASAHQELLKTGASGMIAYRYQTKDSGWQWLQTSSRLVYKNSKPDFVISTHRPLMEEEGRDLLGKRTMDFKVSYLDAGLTNSYFSDSDSLGSSSCLGSQIQTGQQQQSQQSQQSVQSQQQQSPQPQPQPQQRVNRRYKTQLRDFLSTCRSKRTNKLAAVAQNSQLSPSTTASGAVAPSMLGPMSAPTSVDYLGPTATAVDASAAVVAAATYGNLNSLPYPGAASYAAPATAGPETGHLSAYISHAAAPTYHHQPLYPTTALDNRYLTAATENLFQYRALGGYYPDYHSAAAASSYNGFLDLPPTYESHHHHHHHPHHPQPHQQQHHQQHQQHHQLSGYAESGRSTSGYGSLLSSDRGTVGATSVSSNSAGSSPAAVVPNSGGQNSSHGGNNNSGNSNSGSGSNNNGMLTPKLEESSGSEPMRQTVLMWGAPPAPPQQQTRSTPPRSNGSYSPPVASQSANIDPRSDPLKSLQEMNSLNGECKWKRSSPVAHAAPSPPRPKPQQAQQHYPPITSVVPTHFSTTGGYPQQHEQSQSHSAQEPEQQQQHMVVGNGSTGTGQCISPTAQQQRQQRLLLSATGRLDQLGDTNNVCLGDPKSDTGSPLLSISEVTNTLLNQ